jgi:hypothetical protein
MANIFLASMAPVIVLLVSVILSPSLVVFATSNQASEDGSNSEGSNDSCRDSGYRAGRDGPFSQETYDHCGDEYDGDRSYLDGFIDGCMDAGNTRDVCESATHG